MNSLSIRNVDFLFKNHAVDKSKMHSTELIEEYLEEKLAYGNAYIHQWNFDGISILHTRHFYIDHYTFENKNTIGRDYKNQSTEY